MNAGAPTDEGSAMVKRIINLKSVKFGAGEYGPFRTVKYSPDLEGLMSKPYYNLPKDHVNQRTIKERILAMTDFNSVEVDPSLPENKMVVE